METSQTNKPEVNSEEKVNLDAPACAMCRSKGFRIAAMLVGAFLIFLVGFAGGVAVGLHKARFSYGFGANYERNFVGPHTEMGRPGFMGGMMRDFSGGDFRNAHGLAGTIISISGNNLVIKDRNGNENNVAVTDKTLIKHQGGNLTVGDLKQNEQVVIVGNPDNNGTINADLIRVFDSGNNTNQPPTDNTQPSGNTSPTQNNNQPSL
jgi:hypothetical protein